MFARTSHQGRGLRAPRAALCLAAASLLLLPAPLTVAQTTDTAAPTLVRVEEDWSLLVTQPVADLASPQVSSQMSPDPGQPEFCNFHLNSCDIPSFSQGGLQLQVWQDQSCLATATSDDRSVLATPDELITWTQYLKVEGNVLVFGISAASSQTWGDFSGGALQVVLPGAAPVLDNYSSEYSQQNSGITFGANRVASLVIVEVRKYYSDGSVKTEHDPKVVYVDPNQ
jgi:hypothetical protein